MKQYHNINGLEYLADVYPPVLKLNVPQEYLDANN